MKEIPLTQGKIALVDDEDYERVNQHKWQAHIDHSKRGSTWYAIRTDYPNGRNYGVTVKMHREILGMKVGDPLRPDHIDGNGLNNQRNNLRISTQAQNVANRRKLGEHWKSKYKGVTNHAETGKWRARIGHGKKVIYLGLFKDEVDAATAYNFAAYELHGEFARFNAPDGAR